MNVISIIVFVVVCGLTTWLLVDTILWIVKRSKAKKQVKEKIDEVKKD